MALRQQLGRAQGASRRPDRAALRTGGRSTRIVVRAEAAAPTAAADAPAANAPATASTDAPAPAPAPAPVTHAPEPDAANAGAGFSKALLLQGFAWDSWKKGGGNWYGKLKESIPTIQELGITHVWLPPPSHSVSKEGYLPGQLYDLNSKYGNEEQLVDLCAALKAAGIKPMADIVINHRCADETENGVYNSFADTVDHKGASIDWGRWAITSDDPVFHGKGNPDTGDDYGAAPDLDHANPDLRAALVDWMTWLQQDIGFEGWRFDYVRGFGSRFIKEYVDTTVGADSLNVGEYWTEAKWNGADLDYNQDESRQKLCDWINENEKRSTAFDFPTKALLQEAAKNTQYDRLRDKDGKAPGLLGWWPSRTVTFLENHDTGSTQQHWPFPSEQVGMGYAYIITHPGVPCIFWDHVFEWGDELKKQVVALSALRSRAGIVSSSKLEILAADSDMYVARVGDSVIVKLGPRADMGDLVPSEAEGWKFVMSGKDWAVWEKTA